jgi:hypothetical protein
MDNRSEYTVEFNIDREIPAKGLMGYKFNLDIIRTPIKDIYRYTITVRAGEVKRLLFRIIHFDIYDITITKEERNEQE